MSKLLLVEGCTGSGKSTVTEYLENIGYDRHSFDDYVMALANCSEIKKFSDLLKIVTYPDSGIVSGTSMKDATEILRRYPYLGTTLTDKKYLLRLKTYPIIAIQRKMNQRGWSIETAERRVRKQQLTYPFPDISGLVVLEYDNNTLEDLERIKSELKKSLVA